MIQFRMKYKIYFDRTALGNAMWGVKIYDKLGQAPDEYLPLMYRSLREAWRAITSDMAGRQRQHRRLSRATGGRFHGADC